LWVISVCARKLDRDPRFVIAFVAFNPIFIIYAVGGFHNDFFMLLPLMGAIAFLLHGRDRWAGAMLVLAVAVKFTAVILLPFLLIGARTRRRCIDLLIGAALAAAPLLAMSLALFGFSLPNLSQQSTLLTDFSIPQVVGLLIGAGGGTPGLLRIADVLVAGVVVYLIWRRRQWVSSAGWATLALIASLAWLMPWYVVWLLPLAALGTSIQLRRAAIALTLFLMLTFLPALSWYLSEHNIDPLRGPAGRHSEHLMRELQRGS
jgi:hypothetical protein